MKIATFNANSIRSRAPIVIDWLAENQPDVLCVQETKAQDKDFPVDAFAGSGYEIAFKGQKAYNGVAIFSKHSISEVSFGLDEEPKDEPRLAKAVVNGVAIINTYVPQGRDPKSEMFQYKLDWYKRLGEYFDRHFSKEERIVWVGDLNIAMDERDVHDPKKLWGSVCYCQEVQDAVNRIKQWGFEDMFRKHNDEEGQYTFWDYRVPNGLKRNIGWRLDYVMATEAMAKKCSDCWVDKKPRELTKPSDHTFLIAEFDV
ncbi:MAG: exodeoxyribonuclease III [Anaerohalosphaera sp.]|nr:exodeoxyribonuclease III [Anaerohalosphaera sp.]